jgi:hypothetical protein
MPKLTPSAAGGAMPAASLQKSIRPRTLRAGARGADGMAGTRTFIVSHRNREQSADAMILRHGDMTIDRTLPTDYYVYAIRVDGVVRYIGKGKGLRLYAHMKEARSRLNRAFKLQNINSRLQQNLTKAVRSGATVVEQVLVDNLTETAAYKLEYDKLREYVLAGKRDQLWNVIPPSIQTPQELEAFTKRLQRNLNSRDRWIRYFSERTLAALTGHQIHSP